MAQAGEWKVQREYRRVVDGGGNAETVAFRFCDGGHAQPDGEDVIVVDADGNILPSRVLFSKRGGDTWVAYQGSKAKGQVAVYYGGGGSGGSGGRWQPQLSLMLTTVPLPNAALATYKPIAAAAESGRVYGVGFVPNIWQTPNPYGPQDNFASAFVGHLNIDKPGKYHVFTCSDEASFVLIDGKEVCSWPGRHKVGGGKGEHGGDVELTKGQHKIEYYHAEVDGEQFMALGWTTPGSDKYEVVPQSAFVHTPIATAGALERRGGGPLAACEWQQVDQLLHEDNQYTRFRFNSQCKGVPPKAKVEWDYGDGVKIDRDGYHVYVGDGPFGCQVRITDETGKLLNQYQTIVRIEPPMKNLTILDTAQVREYVDAVMKYDFSKVPPEAMSALWELAETQEDADFIRPFTEAYVARFGHSGGAWPVADRLAAAYSLKEPQKAVELYAKLASAAPSKLDAARARMEQIELILHKLKDPKRALAVATGIRDLHSGLEARVAAVKVGDVYRDEGDLEKAEDAYRAVQKASLEHMDRREVAVREGGYMESVSSHIDHGHLRAAREMLVQWEADYPTGKLSGDLILMTAKYFEALGDHQRALDELTTLTKINPLTPFLPEVELRMARAYAKLGNAAKARELRDKVIREYPNSRAAKDAQSGNY